MFYCKGKGGVCDTPCKDEACEFYDGTGAVLMKPAASVADRMRGMTDQQLAEAIMDLHLRMCDPEFDLSELWCNEENGCTEEFRMLHCDAGKRRECVMRYLQSPAEVRR